MATAILTKANRLILDKRNTLAINGNHGWGVCWCGKTSSLEAALDLYAEDVVSVSFHTYSEDTAAQDQKTYGRRLQKISPRYQFSGWQNQVIDGYTHKTIFVGHLTRIGA